MLQRSLMVLALALAAAPVKAQGLFELGEELYAENCAMCHMPEGAGDPPTFPALSGNEQLADLPLIVSNVHQGQGNMPPFPDFTAEQVAALATYIRTAWGNEFGEVATEEVAGILEGLGVEGASRSVWEGVYTEEQAARGRSTYTGPCSLCHGRRLDGAPDDPDMRPSPPLAHAKFLRNWDGKSLATLFEFTRATMPMSNPGYMSDQQYVDIIAYMLAESDLPPGDEELPTDPQSLARVVIEQEQ